MTSHDHEAMPLADQQEIGMVKRFVAASTLAAVALLGSFSANVAPAEAQDAAAQVTESNTTTFASINVLGVNHPSGRKLGSDSARVDRLVDTIETQDYSVVALQEVEPYQSNRIKAKLDKRFVYIGAANNQNPLIVNSNDFNVLETGKINFPYYGDKGLQHGGFGSTATIENKITGEQFDVSDEHFVAWNEDSGSDKGGAQKRTEGAKATAAYHAKKAQQNPTHIQVAMHDGNYIVEPRYRTDKFTPKVKDVYYRGKDVKQNFPYCEMTKRPDVLQSVSDMARGLSGQCPDMKADTYDQKYTVDWVYMSPPERTPEYNVAYEFDLFTNNALKHSTDHRAAVATRTVTPTPQPAPTETAAAS